MAKTPPLPSEVWRIILDIVIEEGIIRLNQCDYTTFPHIRPSNPPSAGYHFYNSYYRLRLVCRTFDTLLRAGPCHSFAFYSSLPLPITTRSLYFDLKDLLDSHFQCLFAGTSTFGRLVSLSVNCGISPSDFLEASAGGAFPNIKRLILKVDNKSHWPPDGPFWAHLHRAFPFLVTLILLAEYWTVPEERQWKEGDEIVCFEWLEILYFSSKVPYLGCRFPRLRHASIWGCSSPELEILLRSPHLESLLIRSYFLAGHRINVTSRSRLKLLGFDYDLYTRVVPLGRDHPVEHILLYYPFIVPDLDLFARLWRMAPTAYRIIMEFPTPTRQSRWRESYEQIGGEFDSFGTSMLLPVHDDRCLTFERKRGTADVTGAVLRKVWSKIRR